MFKNSKWLWTECDDKKLKFSVILGNLQLTGIYRKTKQLE